MSRAKQRLSAELAEISYRGLVGIWVINQLWVADITYIRLREESVYLAVVLDALSRRVVGWALDDSLHAALVLRALRSAIEERRPAPGLVHHSVYDDNGLSQV